MDQYRNLLYPERIIKSKLIQTLKAKVEMSLRSKEPIVSLRKTYGITHAATMRLPLEATQKWLTIGIGILLGRRQAIKYQDRLSAS